MKLKRGFKQFLIRLGIFAVLGYTIPFFIKLIAISIGLKEAFVYKYTYIDIFIAGLVLAFVALKRKELLKLKPYKNHLVETILLAVTAGVFYYLAFYIKYKINITYLTTNPTGAIIFLFLFYGIALAVLGLAIFNTRFLHRFFNSIAASVGIVIAYFASVLIMSIHWRFFANNVAKASAFLLKFSVNNVLLDFSRLDPRLTADSFTVGIGSPCSGVTSLSMFIGLFVLIAIFDYAKINKNRILPFFLIGLAGMFFMAILRVYVLMLIGAKASPDLALNMFHSHAGWLFFVLYLLGYWYLTYPKLFKR